MSPSRPLALGTALWLLAAQAVAQSALERRVGTNTAGRPLEFRAFTEHDIGALAQAAGVPIGFEPLPPPSPPRRPVRLTGLSMRDAIDAMLALDSRYEAVDDAGVIMFHPASAPVMAQPWPGDAVPPVPPQNPLDLPTPPVNLGETTGRDALALVAALLGAPPTTAITFADTRTFVLDAPGGTVRSLLNAIVRAHGELVWVFGPVREQNPVFPYTLLFMSGVHGMGLRRERATSRRRCRRAPLRANERGWTERPRRRCGSQERHVSADSHGVRIRRMGPGNHHRRAHGNRDGARKRTRGAIRTIRCLSSHRTSRLTTSR